MPAEDCPFQFDANMDTARCRLLEQLAGTGDLAPVRVSLEACHTCLRFSRGTLLQQHPVFASALFQWSLDQDAALANLQPNHEGDSSVDRNAPCRGVMLDVSDHHAAPGHSLPDVVPEERAAQIDGTKATPIQEPACHQRRISQGQILGIRRMAEAALEAQILCPPARLIPSVDVILCVDAADAADAGLRDSVASILNQDMVNVVLHLIDTRGCLQTSDPMGASEGGQILRDFLHGGNVFVHRCPTGTSALSALHDIIESLCGSWVAVQCSHAISSPERLMRSVELLEERRAEFFVCPCDGWDSGHRDTSPAVVLARLNSTRDFHPATLVLRRSTFVDMGGVASVADDDVELLFRAHCEGRLIAIGTNPLVRITRQQPLSPVARRNAEIVPAGGSLRTRARGFPLIPMSCDVILPFHGHLPWVEEALQSLLIQRHCDVVIHLVDDASDEDTSEFLRRWSAVSAVRVYRNLQNIGQFQSFNNIVKFCHTPCCAVQDADDISLPDRLSRAAQLLHYSDADIFGGAVELFGADDVLRPVFQHSEQREKIARASIRQSFYPRTAADSYFIENPTAVFRTDMFRWMGGFADFGDRLMNRASLDTEFQQRCRSHGIRCAITRDIVLRYRVHETSATQDHQSGWGTPARTNAGRNVQQRLTAFQQGSFDPRSFGSLGRSQHLTLPLN